jgi:hypothetical protein
MHVKHTYPIACDGGNMGFTIELPHAMHDVMGFGFVMMCQPICDGMMMLFIIIMYMIHHHMYGVNGFAPQ